MDRPTGVGQQPQGRLVSIWLSGQKQVLDRAAKTDIHFAVERVDSTGVARAVGEQLEPLRRDVNDPGLRVVRFAVRIAAATSAIGPRCRSH